MLACALGLPVGSARAQTLSKGHQIIINRGIQLHGLVANYDVFHLNTFQNGGFTTVHWLWDSTMNWLGPAPGMPWARWARSPAETPPLPSEATYAGNLVAIQIGDEQDLNQESVRTSVAAWFNSIRPQFPNTVLYCNSYGGQVTNPNLDAFINTSQPDMLSFDTYPFRPDGLPIGGSPKNLYGDMQRYRKFALAHGIPYAMYTQTFHDAVTRDPSESELRVEYFAGLAFGYTWFNCFTYNTGATSLFVGGSGDTTPLPLYAALTEIHRRVRNLGPSMVRLRNMDVRFVNGQHMENGTPVNNDTPIDVLNWEFGVNDPWLRGWAITNLGTKNSGLRGDVWLAWFKPLDESFDGPNYTDEIYMMVVNGLTWLDGSAVDCRQEVKLNFAFGSSGITQVQRLRQDNGQLELITLPEIPNSGGRRQLVLTLDGGTGELFKFYTTATFIGVESPDVTPPGPVTGFTALAQPQSVQLSWQNPSASDFTGTLIRRKTGGFPAHRDDGQLVADKAGAPGSTDSYLDTGLADGATYYYAAFAHDHHRNYAAPATVSVTLDLVPPGPVSSLTAMVAAQTVSLAWQNPPDGDFAATRIMRKTTAPPAHKDDGELVVEKPGAPGAADGHQDSGLTPATPYYYAAFARDVAFNYSAGMPASARTHSLRDFDDDGDCDQADFAVFQKCLSGPYNPYPAGCAPASLDGDIDVDEADFNLFLPCMNGPNQPPPC